MCLVEMGTPMRDRATGEAILDEHGKQKIGWIPKPVIGCGQMYRKGMHVKTSQMVKDSRELWNFFSLIINLTVNLHQLESVDCRSLRLTTEEVTMLC